MDSIMGFILRIGSLIIFIVCLIGSLKGAHTVGALICGWYILIYAELEDIKEILRNGRTTSIQKFISDKEDCKK